jgi:hypothetical protein
MRPKLYSQIGAGWMKNCGKDNRKFQVWMENCGNEN